MLVTCPKCGSKTRIATSRSISSETRELYCQCLNLHCGSAFVSHLSFSHVIESTGRKPDPELQPELCKGELNQIDIFEAENSST
ncbi:MULTISPECIES: ogr/Delta-like zinc finger family protein [Vibrio]|uniref:ogr/Delta-like zinc finger family protein n=1 Tax=Vibrio TaxID=662 RepID=UPI000C83F2AB|nr:MULTISPECIES: ogr/Delta-like zinc finger family protein [Vibrio]PTO70131.1 zinc-binding protein [Vibrio splendidus]